MILEAIAAAVLGLVLAYAATKRLPARLPSRPLVLATGSVSALTGGLISSVVLGPGNTLVSLAVAAAAAAAILSVLLGDPGRTASARRLRTEAYSTPPA